MSIEQDYSKVVHNVSGKVCLLGMMWVWIQYFFLSLPVYNICKSITLLYSQGIKSIIPMTSVHVQVFALFQCCVTESV